MQLPLPDSKEGKTGMGRAPDYDIQIALKLTASQNDFLDEIARLHDTTKSEVIRQLIDQEFVRVLEKEYAL